MLWLQIVLDIVGIGAAAVLAPLGGEGKMFPFLLVEKLY